MSFRREYERWAWGNVIGATVMVVLLLALVPILLWGWVAAVVVVVVAAVAYGVLRYLERPRD